MTGRFCGYVDGLRRAREAIRAAAGTTPLTPDEVKQECLRILVAFDGFCREQSLRYSLAGGTMLGAVRHGGFIPWDDDIDVMMPRPDYERLLDACRTWQEGTGLMMAGHPDMASPDSVFVKLVDPAIVIETEAIDEPLFLGIDVFPIDGLPADEKAVERIYATAEKHRRLLLASNADSAVATSAAKRAGKKAFRMLNNVLPLVRSTEKKLSRLARSHPFEGSPFVGSIAWGLYGTRERLPRKVYDEFVAVDFEGHRFSAIVGWEAYLRSLFGDYLQLPPEDQRTSHGLRAWRVPDAAKAVG